MLTEVYFGFQSQFNLKFSVHYNRGLFELIWPTFNQQFYLGEHHSVMCKINQTKLLQL